MLLLLAYLVLPAVALASLLLDPAGHATELLQLVETGLALVLPAISITNLIKGLASRIETLSPFASGSGALIASWLVGAALAAVAVALGWYVPDGPWTAAGLWGLVSVLSNLVYVRYLSENGTLERLNAIRSR